MNAPHPSSVTTPSPACPSSSGLSGVHSPFWLDIVLCVEVVGDLIAFWGGMNLAFHARTHLHSLFGHELLSLRLALSAYTGHFIFGSILFLGLAGRMGMYSPQNVLRLRKTFIAATNAAIVWAL